MANVKLVSETKGAGELINKSAQELISYVARVSNKKNQHAFHTGAKLLRYLVSHKHWSPFEHAYFTFEINCTRGIASQILRHRSFCAQEFSMRYAEAENQIVCAARRQDKTNRQNSIDDLDDDTRIWFENAQREVWELSHTLYKQALKKGVAKECARFLLPLNTATTIYLTGSVRSWIHYIDVRTSPETQKEHREIAEAIKKQLSASLPDVAEAMGWT